MEISQLIKCTASTHHHASQRPSDYPPASQHAVPSPDGEHIASVHRSHLLIRTLPSLETIRSISLSPSQSQPARATTIRWAPPRKNGLSSRLLLAESDSIRVYDLHDAQWSAKIDNGSGGMGKITSASFGRTDNEVLALSDFGARATAWFLDSGRHVEIRDPKALDSSGSGGGTNRPYAYRPTTGHLALLARPGPQDVLTLLAPGSYKVVRSVVLPSQDAQGLKWSPDGRWLAVWEAPGLGYRVWVYTADGHLYRVYGGESESGTETEGVGLGLGVKSLEWSPRGDFLAVGGFDGRVTLLGTRTFSPTVLLAHTSTIHLPSGGDVWQEHVSASNQRTYTLSPQPVSPPAAPASSAPSAPSTTTTTTSSAATDTTPLSLGRTAAMSLISFNAPGTLLATKSDAHPTAVWLWDLSALAPHTVLLQHAPVRALRWHPSIPGLLLVLCHLEEPVLYLWDAGAGRAPSVLGLAPVMGGGDGGREMREQREKGRARVEARWVETGRERRPAVVCGDGAGWVVCWPEGREPVLTFERREENGVGDESEDSLFEALTGRKKGVGSGSGSGGEGLNEGTMTLAADGESEEDSGVLDDTFNGKGGEMFT